MIFTLNPVTAKVSIDGRAVNVSKPVEIEYGLHQMRITADGYDTVAQYIRVGEPSANIAVELEKSEESSSEKILLKKSSGKAADDKDHDKDDNKEKDDEQTTSKKYQSKSSEPEDDEDDEKTDEDEKKDEEKKDNEKHYLSLLREIQSLH